MQTDLKPFVARDPDADVGLLNHGDVVCAVADRQRDGAHALLHQTSVRPKQIFYRNAETEIG